MMKENGISSIALVLKFVYDIKGNITIIYTRAKFRKNYFKSNLSGEYDCGMSRAC